MRKKTGYVTIFLPRPNPRSLKSNTGLYETNASYGGDVYQSLLAHGGCIKSSGSIGLPIDQAVGQWLVVMDSTNYSYGIAEDSHLASFEIYRIINKLFFLACQ